MDKVKIAYLLTCHKSPEQINRFIKQLLANGECDIYIHIDKKNEKIKDEIIENEHVFCYSVYDVRWGSVEIVLAGLYLMEQVSESGRDYTHIYFGSGQDMLVRRGLYEYLAESKSKAFIRINGEITGRSRAASRYLIRWHKRLLIRNNLHPYRFVRIVYQFLCKIGIKIRRNKVVLTNKVRFYGGRTWFIITKDLMDYIVAYCSENKDYVEFWKDSLAADLMFFQTIIMNSPYADKIEDEVMYVCFGKTFKTKNHPLTITANDIKNVDESGKFFARKFELGESDEAANYYLQKICGNDVDSENTAKD